MLGNEGVTVDGNGAPSNQALGSVVGLQDLLNRLNSGQIDVLISLERTLLTRCRESSESPLRKASTVIHWATAPMNRTVGRLFAGRRSLIMGRCRTASRTLFSDSTLCNAALGFPRGGKVVNKVAQAAGAEGLARSSAVGMNL